MFEKTHLSHVEENPHRLLPWLHHNNLAGLHAKEPINLAGDPAHREHLPDVPTKANLFVDLRLLPPLFGTPLPTALHAAHRPLCPGLLLDRRQFKGEILRHGLVLLKVQRLWWQEQSLHHPWCCLCFFSSHRSSKEWDLFETGLNDEKITTNASTFQPAWTSLALATTLVPTLTGPEQLVSVKKQ